MIDQFNCILQVENQDFEFVVYYEYYPTESDDGFFDEYFAFYELKTLDGIDCNWLLTDKICDLIIEQIKECKDED